MKRQEEINGLQTLAELHEDRLEGYKKASEDTSAADMDLRNLFGALASFSEEAKMELDVFIASEGGEMTDDENSFLSKIHRTWMDIKTAIAANDRQTILSSCEFGEKIIIGAYESMLENKDFTNVKARMMLHSHLGTLVSSLKTIQEMEKLEAARV